MTSRLILVVEDNATIGMLLSDMLEEMGHTICAVAAGEADAIFAAARYKPDLLIVDAALNDGSGMSAVDNICRNGHVPHLFMSGDTSKVIAQRPGAVVLQKPFREDALAKAIQRACDQRTGD